MKKDVLKNDFITYYSHEIGNKLNMIGLSIDNIEKIIEDKNDMKRREIEKYIEYIKNGMKDIYIFHDEIKSMAINNYTIKYEMKEYRMSMIREKIESIMKLRTNNIGVEVEMGEMEDGGERVRVDITRFMEVVNNIIDNAIKYTYIDNKKEKKIRIEIMRNVIYDRSNDRSIWTIETDENREIDNKVRYIVISIGDNGIGIENSRLEGIFKPFYRKRMAMDVNGT